MRVKVSLGFSDRFDGSLCYVRDVGTRIAKITDIIGLKGLQVPYRLTFSLNRIQELKVIAVYNRTGKAPDIRRNKQ